MKKFIVLISICCVIAISYSFNEKKESLTPFPITIPEGWPKPTYDFSKNPLSVEGFELGKKLFFDGILSKDGNFPCASCHQQFGAFNNYDHVLSHGYNNQLTIRNAPALQNLAWQSSFMWDGSIHHLDEQPFAPINAANEMAETTENVLLKLNADTAYTRKFTIVFGKGEITKEKLGKALSQYMLHLISNNSKYDKVLKGEATFNNSEQVGYRIFKEKCVSCHKEPLFTDYSFRSIGLQIDYALNDLGRIKITNDSTDLMKFRVPSLRNAQVTFPYAHDGRFPRLYNMLQHYNQIIDFPNNDPLIKNLELNPWEIGRIITFINTLTDSSFLTNKLFVPNGYNISPSLMHTH